VSWESLSLEGREGVKESMMKDIDDLDYGDAINFNGAVTSSKKDTEGNYVSVSAVFSTNIDFSKIPQDVSKEEIFFKSYLAAFTLDVKKGMFFHGYVVSNPDYESFKDDQEGLTEYLQKFVANDPEQMEDLFQFIAMIDAFATAMLEGNMLSKYINTIHSKK
jgi:hypothetical protein